MQDLKIEDVEMKSDDDSEILFKKEMGFSLVI
jgi:hypothetical protein